MQVGLACNFQGHLAQAIRSVASIPLLGHVLSHMSVFVLGTYPCPVLFQSTEKGKNKPKGKGRKRKPSAKSEEDFEDESTPEPMPAPVNTSAAPASNGGSHRASTPAQPSPPSDITSSNAYMLLYKRRDWQLQNEQPTPVVPLPAWYALCNLLEYFTCNCFTAWCGAAVIICSTPACLLFLPC